MSSYEISFYAREDLSFGRNHDGHYTITVKEGATPDTIKIVDNDKDGGDRFSGSMKAGETGQAAYGESGGEHFDGDPIQPLAALPGNHDSEMQVMAIGVGSPVHTIGYGFNYEPEPGEAMQFDYDAYINEPSYPADSLYVEDQSDDQGEGDESDDQGEGDESEDHSSGPSGGSEASGASGASRPSGPSGPSAPSGPSGPDPVCFARGTLIRTRHGEMPIELLSIGDRVWTAQSGFQPVKWICSSTVSATGAFAPIRIRAGVLDAKQDLLVSPAHRMMLDGAGMQLLFDAPRVLVAAKNMVNGTSIQRVDDMATVTYFHMLFEKHEIVQANGTLSESFYPVAEAVDGFSSLQQEELFALFPHLKAGDFGRAPAYPPLLAHEAAVAMQQMRY
jgi:hypothetical protein